MVSFLKTILFTQKLNAILFVQGGGGGNGGNFGGNQYQGNNQHYQGNQVRDLSKFHTEISLDEIIENVLFDNVFNDLKHELGLQ